LGIGVVEITIIYNIVKVENRREGEAEEKTQKVRLLTSSDNSSAGSTSLSRSTTQRENKAYPAEANLLAGAVEVWDERAGRLELGQLSGIRRVSNRQEGFEPAWARRDGTTVHEDVEAGASTVGTVATLADAAEGECGDVKCGVVDGDTAGAGHGEDYVG
jgi:hypothetical protein